MKGHKVRRLAGVVAALGVLELVSLGAIGLLSPTLHEPIRTRSSILREQTERIARLLDSTAVRREALDSVLGWLYVPGFESPTDHISMQGLRALRLYSETPGREVVRVAAFGDSFVYGNEVADADAWTAQLEVMFPNLEVLNYGVGGYGTDQAYLRFQREGMELQPAIVMIGFVPDDLGRVVNVYRRFRSNREWPLAKPRFRLDGSDSLTLIGNPLSRRDSYRQLLTSPQKITALGEYDYWYDPLVYRNPLYDLSATLRLATAVYARVSDGLRGNRLLSTAGVFDARSEAFRIQLELFSVFAEAIEGAGARSLIVLFPDRASLERAASGQPVTYAPMRDALAARGLPYIDLLAAFDVRTPPGALRAWFMKAGHYSPEANRLVARHLGQALRDLGYPVATAD